MDRHAAHGDVLAQVLAALGQHDAERRRGRDRVVEEQLVEIAHAVPEQAVGVGRLDLQELRHGRGRFADRGGGGRRRRGFRGPGGVGRCLGRRIRRSSTGGGVCFARVRLPAIGGSPPHSQPHCRAR